MMNTNIEKKWKVYFHDSETDNWKWNSYKQVHEINSITQFWQLFNHIHRFNFKLKNIFIMKENILPQWEDKENINGTICSIQINNDKFVDLFIKLSIIILTNNFSDDERLINGISVCEKNGFILIKLWLKKCNNSIKSIINNVINNFYKNISVRYKKIKIERM